MKFIEKFAKFGCGPAKMAAADGLQALTDCEERNAELMRKQGPEQNELDEALKEFRLSVHAWSEAAYSRPRRTPAALPHRRAGRLAVGWALGCVMAVMGISGGIWEHHQQGMRVAAARVVEQERLAVEQRARQNQKENEDLLAKVDSDVSREVPVAMEPLAELMDGDETR
jgi:hypothetical protein